MTSVDFVFSSLRADYRLPRHDVYRFTDQKCTPDVLKVCAQCILAWTGGSSDEFTRKELEGSVEFKEHMVQFFTKPDPARIPNEVNKTLGQPLVLLAYSGVLNIDRSSRTYKYAIRDGDAINFIAGSESNSWKFLVEYLSRVLKDNGQLGYFEKYRDSQHLASDLKELQDDFYPFASRAFGIGLKGSSRNEDYRRIFPKILNPLACYWAIPGRVSGRPGKGPFPFADLMYNQRNWRDIRKAKNVPRSEQSEHVRNAVAYMQGESRRVKREVLEFHGYSTEVYDSLAAGRATQAHHIFPQSQFPALSALRENIIALTASQHNVRAHPNNNTGVVSPTYQIDCILAKISSIENSLSIGSSFYTTQGLIATLNGGFGWNLDGAMSIGAVRQFALTTFGRSA